MRKEREAWWTRVAQVVERSIFPDAYSRADLVPIFQLLPQESVTDMVKYRLEGRRPYHPPILDESIAPGKSESVFELINYLVHTEPAVALTIYGSFVTILDQYSDQMYRGRRMVPSQLWGASRISWVLENDDVRDDIYLHSAIWKSTKNALSRLTHAGNLAYGVAITKHEKQTRSWLVNTRVAFPTEDDPSGDWAQMWDGSEQEEWGYGFTGMAVTDRPYALSQLRRFVERTKLAQNQPGLYPFEDAIWVLRCQYGDGQEGLDRFVGTIQAINELSTDGIANTIGSWFPDSNSINIPFQPR